MQQLVMHMIQLEPGKLPTFARCTIQQYWQIADKFTVRIWEQWTLLKRPCPRAGKRLSAAAYLEQWGPRLFPAYFEAVLHPFFTALLPMDADERVAAMLSSFPQFALFMQPPQPARSSPPRPEAAAGSGTAEEKASQSRDASEGPGSLDRSVVDAGGAAGGLGTQLSSMAGPAMQVGQLPLPPSSPKNKHNTLLIAVLELTLTTMYSVLHCICTFVHGLEKKVCRHQGRAMLCAWIIF